jgi:hypothetical protein
MAVRLVFERFQAIGRAVADPPRTDRDDRNAPSATTPDRR